MDVGRERVRRGWLLALVVLMLAVLAPVVFRSVLDREDALVEIVFPDGDIVSWSPGGGASAAEIERAGVYQNQFGNWRDQGTYTGVRLSALIGTRADYDAMVVIASDGYTVRIERARVEDSEYPMVLAYRFDGIEVPAWEDGPRIAVLPEDGDVSNEEYNAESAGSYWAKNVARIQLVTGESTSPSG